MATLLEKVSTLISAINVTQGLKKGGWIVINASEANRASYESLVGDFRVAVVDASKISFENRLGARTSPVVNSAILGGFAKVYKKPLIDSILDTIREEVPIKSEENANAAKMAYEQIVEVRER